MNNYTTRVPGTSDIGEITVKKISEDLKNINHTKLTQEEQDNLEGNN
jgi:Ser-tRNA(Ala) deacylase AlaX